MVMSTALISNDAVVLGLLMAVLGVLFYAKSLGGKWDKFFTFVPIILLCYLIPSLMNSFGLISSKGSNLWPIAKNYFLPAALVLMTLSIDLKAIIGLGPKALIMFLTAVIGIVLGGPIAIFLMSLFSPEVVGGEGINAVWRGFATLAGSWIGGGANQTAMLELYGYNPERYAAMVAIDIVVANIWMIFLLYGAGNPEPIDRWLKADSSAIENLKVKMENYTLENERISQFSDFMIVLAIAFGAVGFSHLVADIVASLLADIPAMEGSILQNSFFWIVVVSTTIGLSLSFTKARKYEGAGASKLGTVFIFLLVAIIGTKMDVFQIADAPLLFLVGIIYPALAPVGVLLAVLGYALGTYGAILCAQLMQMVAPG